jgi:hypothetical protein
MKTLCAALAALALAAAASPQEPIRIRKPPDRTSVRATNMDPGDGEEVDLATLANDIGSYDKKIVRTRGRLEHVVSASRDLSERYYILSAGFARVTIVPGYGVFREDLDEMVRGRSELRVRGIVRMLGNPMSMDEHAELPPLPQPHPELPRVSLTLFEASRGGSSSVEIDPSAITRQILRDPARFAGKPIRIIGQFRGRNLFGDLPGESRRSATDWVLKEGTHALWIVGRAPKGHGFRLDADYKGDATRWLEVEGKPEVEGGVVYLRASRVTLAPRRKEQQ